MILNGTGAMALIESFPLRGYGRIRLYRIDRLGLEFWKYGDSFVAMRWGQRNFLSGLKNWKPY